MTQAKLEGAEQRRAAATDALAGSHGSQLRGAPGRAPAAEIARSPRMAAQRRQIREGFGGDAEGRGVEGGEVEEQAVEAIDVGEGVAGDRRNVGELVQLVERGKKQDLTPNHQITNHPNHGPAAPVQAEAGPVTQEAAAGTIQRYKPLGEYLVSEGSKFAVTDHGRPESRMFVRSPADVAKLRHIEFESGGKTEIGSGAYTELVPKYKSLEDKLEMEKMYCGKFSRHVTDKSETQESGDAPKGRSLYMKVKGPASAWENHFAPVIMSDGDDRGTFETAARLDYMFFGIYGQAQEQSFAFKTEMAGMLLGLQNDVLSEGLRKQHEELLSKGGKGCADELFAYEQAKQKAQTILKTVKSLELDEKREGEIDMVEVRALMDKIDEHRKKHFDLQAELDKEEKARQDQLQREAQQQKKDKMKKIAAITAAIVIVLGVLLLALL